MNIDGIGRMASHLSQTISEGVGAGVDVGKNVIKQAINATTIKSKQALPSEGATAGSMLKTGGKVVLILVSIPTGVCIPLIALHAGQKIANAMQPQHPNDNELLPKENAKISGNETKSADEIGFVSKSESESTSESESLGEVNSNNVGEPLVEESKLTIGNGLYLVEDNNVGAPLVEESKLTIGNGLYLVEDNNVGEPPVNTKLDENVVSESNDDSTDSSLDDSTEASEEDLPIPIAKLDKWQLDMRHTNLISDIFKVGIDGKNTLTNFDVTTYETIDKEHPMRVIYNGTLCRSPEIIGEGNFKNTYGLQINLAEKTHQVAMTTLNIRGDGKGIEEGTGRDLDELDIRNRKHELNISCMIFSKDLVNVIPGGVLVDNETGNAFIVTKLGREGTLNTAWTNCNLETRKKLLVDIAIGMNSLHGAGFVHRDLHSKNIFIDEGTAYIGDLGTASKIDGDSPDIAIQPLLQSPCRHMKLAEIGLQYNEIISEMKKYKEDDIEYNNLKIQSQKLQQQYSQVKNYPTEDSFAFGRLICNLINPEPTIPFPTLNSYPEGVKRVFENYVKQIFDNNPNHPLKPLLGSKGKLASNNPEAWQKIFESFVKNTLENNPNDPLKSRDIMQFFEIPMLGSNAKLSSNNPEELQKMVENFINKKFENNPNDPLKSIVMELMAYDPEKRLDGDALIERLSAL